MAQQCSELKFHRMMTSSTLLANGLGKTTKIDLGLILAPRQASDFTFRKTKIICTMGPSCWSVEQLVKMIDAGMNVARLNFSHGDHEAHGKTVQNLREAMKQRPNKQIAILLDTKGPEIRTGMLGTADKKVSLKAGQSLRLTNDYNHLGDETCIACSYPKLPTSVKPGNTILMADGGVTCRVTSCGDTYVDTEVLNDIVMGERKNMNLPGVKVDLPCVGEKDTKDILEFGIPQGCAFVAASFVQTADDVKAIRNLLGPRGRRIKIIPKIENVEGLMNFDAILAEADGIMVARGDLGMEIPPEKVFLAQKMMIAKANVAGKPIITATQMLESMTKNPRPTRAEVTDVANAVLDGTDAVMLSGETAGGEFPIDAVKCMAKVCLEAESCIDYSGLYRALHAAIPRPVSTSEGVCCACVETAIDIQASLIIALTETGVTARYIAKYRPPQLILALSASDSTVNQLQVHRGIFALKVDSFQGTDSVLKNALDFAKANGLVQSKQCVVAVHGMKEEVAGASNLLKVLEA